MSCLVMEHENFYVFGGLGRGGLGRTYYFGVLHVSQESWEFAYPVYV